MVKIAKKYVKFFGNKDLLWECFNFYFSLNNLSRESQTNKEMPNQRVYLTSTQKATKVTVLKEAFNYDLLEGCYRLCIQNTTLFGTSVLHRPTS
ncbi:unnamed protein product [Moneuplotes crassus]|uniref:Uncharacterized protein n=1 Tax=Euplotes crassus TaxID=5936 RepID=A0AAD1XNE1_EUPCR|nr:unnamed protein product [Moneuplotes crassus]